MIVQSKPSGVWDAVVEFPQASVAVNFTWYTPAAEKVYDVEIEPPAPIVAGTVMASSIHWALPRPQLSPTVPVKVTDVPAATMVPLDGPVMAAVGGVVSTIEIACEQLVVPQVPVAVHVRVMVPVAPQAAANASP